MTFSLNRIILRRALITALAVLIAIIAAEYFSYTAIFWAPLTTVIMIQMTFRTTLRQVFLRLLGVMLSVFIGSLLLLSTLSTTYARMHDIALGGAVGIVIGFLLFSVRADKDFRNSIVPLLQAYKEYLLTIENVFFAIPQSEDQAQAQKRRLEKLLQTQQANFPEWVYDPGFTETFRQGHRYFLVRVEQLGEVLFAMNYIARYPIEPTLLEKFRTPISFCIKEMNHLLQAIIDVLELKKPNAAVSDLSDEIAAVEKVFHQNTPLPLDLLDTSQEYLNICAFIYDLKDLQTLLLQLTKALR